MKDANHIMSTIQWFPVQGTFIENEVIKASGSLSTGVNGVDSPSHTDRGGWAGELQYMLLYRSPSSCCISKELCVDGPSLYSLKEWDTWGIIKN